MTIMGLEGHLRSRLRDQTRRALASGALHPIETHAVVVPDGGVDFVVRSVSSLRRKPIGAPLGQMRDPFTPPYEHDLLVGDISDTHVALLNKYNVLDEHLLIVTREYEGQTRWLTEADFAALLACLGQVDGLGFYNGGTDAGSSQPHKHLQLVPLPLSPRGAAVPMEAVLERTEPKLPFRHAAVRTPEIWWQQPRAHAGAALETYRGLLDAAGIARTGDEQSAPYNLLMTRRWTWVVPRTRPALDGVPVNALGYAGALLARNAADMGRLRRFGPMRVLTRTGVAADTG